MIPLLNNSIQLKYKFLIICLLISAFTHGQSSLNDVNDDGFLNILIIGTSSSIEPGFEEYSTAQIATELQNILSEDTSISININVVSEDIYRTKTMSTGIAGMLTENRNYFCHSLAQYYYWPEDRQERMDNLTGNSTNNWDYVVIGADPYIVSYLPGYYSFGVNKIAAKIEQGGAIPLLLMMWAKNDNFISHFEEFTYRTADGAKVELEVVPAGLVWNALPVSMKDNESQHPTLNGSYVAAASIYSHLLDQSASLSQYDYNDSIADIAYSTLDYEKNQMHYFGDVSFISPYKSCKIGDQNLIYNHGGTSTENGILGGLQWVVSQAGKFLEYGASSPVHFNYGRSSMGDSHLYNVDPANFDYSFGYPLQDDKSTGLVTMLYGLDKRTNTYDVETDLGTARQMINQSELPSARNVPLRTIVAQMLEEIPNVEIFSDNWHLSSDVNKAIGTYMYTILTDDCALTKAPMPTDSAAWRSWMSHKIGYETAWNVMYMNAQTPCSELPVSIITNDTYFEIYPNPSMGSFIINFGEKYESGTFTIRNILGKKVLSQSFKDKSFLQLKIDEAPGIYLVTIDNSYKSNTFRIIKQ